MNTESGKRQLRTVLRSKRRAIPPKQQTLAAQALVNILSMQPWLQRAKRIALYWPADGELDPRPIAHWAWQHNIACYLPVLHRWHKRKLWFTPFTPETLFSRNRFGIPEPIQHRAAPLSAHHLDVVLMPLVGFDRHGGRLGMGGGFYDTTFAFKRRQNGFTKPRLIGIAHSCQEVEQLPLEPWDIGLDAVVTEEGMIV
ncbi:5-formyltetrahydrofolate cyclo-ligase [Gilvimarinus sp. SDUM040013]|uniref:5-formyltetrahydrofolate cyclo-ligase n=1 Tax=Gilvimarinus gilvus TaxID=3058038 RepID=A0ABU4RWB7_9GAMM|nr:5-formyltetrahydrofolate cyclo-ligase [Gilvimarinus sp. SDUM040013]MDO3388572.1 5-formyltetrahydrofolate cyclo-ligase [Gilvimarinus sp. SDUM040013]MDX6848556.1 5-formyltetrahydrofolate cyclo-ligase [Gilvimarinus sp. SDUM040013]